MTLPISVLAALFISLAVFGGYQAYTPVPFWDMWDGYLGFYVQVVNGEWGAWWAQHNEHRIVLSRLFFWLDLALFEGRGWFLLVVNYALMGFVCLLFWGAWRERAIDSNYWPGFFLAAWLFSWIQAENFTWGFQSQFILAQLMPLAAFYFLHRVASADHCKNRYFGIAVLLGVLAIGSMANGILVLPLMTAYALLSRLSWKRSLLLAFLSIVFIGLYFYDFNAPSGHGSLALALQQNPLGVAHYVLLYVGGPFYYLFGKGDFGQVAATLAGIFMIASASVFAWHAIHVARKSSLSLTLLAFILYVGGTALGTAGGRLIFGVDQALASRYMTPALMAWAALFLLYLPKLEAINQRDKIWIPFFVLLLMMLPQQLKALHSKHDVLFEREVAALALELGVRDQPQINNIFPSTEWALSIAEAPRTMDLSIFGITPIKNAEDAVGKSYRGVVSEDHPCQGSLDEVHPIEEESNYLRLRGWVYDPIRNLVPTSVFIVDEKGVVRGVAFTGQARPDVADAIDPAAGYSGFKGYVQADVQGMSLKFIDPESGCQFGARFPVVLFKSSVETNLSSVNVSTAQIQGDNEWMGSDFYHSDLPGLSVFGSFIDSDSDVGSIVLKMKQGDKLLYRSGPTGQRQAVAMKDNPQLASLLPVSTEWVELEFSSDFLPDTFELKFSDNGDGWGEWSAIALSVNDNKGGSL